MKEPPTTEEFSATDGSWLTGSWLYAIFTSMSCLHALHRNGICCTLVSCRTGKRDFPQCGQQYHVLPLISFIILSLKREKGTTFLRLPFLVVWFFGRRGVLLHLSGRKPLSLPSACGCHEIDHLKCFSYPMYSIPQLFFFVKNVALT